MMNFANITNYILRFSSEKLFYFLPYSYEFLLVELVEELNVLISIVKSAFYANNVNYNLTGK